MLLQLGYSEADWSRQLSQKAGRTEKAIPDFVFFQRGEKHFEILDFGCFNISERLTLLKPL